MAGDDDEGRAMTPTTAPTTAPTAATLSTASTATTSPRPRFGGPTVLPDDIVPLLLARPRSEDGVYDARLAYLLSMAAGWAYSDARTLSDKLAYYGLAGATVEHIGVVNDAMLIVAHAFFIRSVDGAFGILAFRGTEPANIISWLTDADVYWKPLDGGRVHAGFYGNVEAVWRGIIERVGAAADKHTAGVVDAQPRAPLRDLYITGHSLGAAMSVVAARRLLDEPAGAAGAISFKELFRGVYTWGQPMVGDRAFVDACAARFAGRYFRHSYGNDVICALPPRSVDEHFVHFGEHRVTTPTKDKQAKVWTLGKPGAPTAASLILPTLATAGASYFTRRLSALRHLKWRWSIDDHIATHYVAASRESLAGTRASVGG